MTHSPINRRAAAVAAALALSVAASAAPAVARPFNVTANGSMVPANSPNTASQANPSTGVHGTAPTIVRFTARDGGFDWGDAGIGAAGALGLSALAIATGLAITSSRRRTPSTANPEHGATPHQRAAGDANRRSHSQSRLVSDRQEALK